MVNKMRIGFPRLGTSGGPQIFMQRLRKSLIRQGLILPRSCFFPFYDIGIFNSVAKNYYGKPYVLRVDGIYFDKTATIPSAQKLNEPIYDSLLHAKGIIYQSRFSKNLIDKKNGPIDKNSAIISNGTNIISIENKVELRKTLGLPVEKKLLITTAVWRRHKRLPEILEIVKVLNRMDKRFGLIIAGDAAQLTKEEYLYPIGKIDPERLYKYYQCADVYLHLCWLDNCPNTVVEAIANGIPVVCSNQGGTREIVEEASAGIVSECDKDVDLLDVDLNNPPLPDTECVIKDILKIFDGYEKVKEKMNKDYVDIDIVARKYAAFITEVWHKSLGTQ